MKRNGNDGSNRCGDDVITDRAILRGVEVEVARTLPFWRCYTDLRAAYEHRPVVLERHTRLICRLPCVHFAGVDVVWAETQVHLRVQTGKAVRSTNSISYARNGAQRWRVRPHLDALYTLGTLHFVHQDAHRRGSRGAEHSFHVQSVVLKEEPARLQCVADTMASFAFVVFSALALRGRDASSSAQLARHTWRGAWLRALLQEQTSGAASSDAKRSGCTLASLDDFVARAPGDALRAGREELRAMCPRSASRVLILGMGGNSMTLALRHLLGPQATLVVLEIEPSVVQACRLAGTWQDTGSDKSSNDANTTLHCTSAEAWLDSLYSATEVVDEGQLFDMVFMDLFEPVEGRMQNGLPLVTACQRALCTHGLLVINDHQLPSEASLEPFAACFGDGQVHAVNVHGWAESVVVCVKQSTRQCDTSCKAEVKGDTTATASCDKAVANAVFALYDALLPGWLPHPSWLRSSRLTRKHACRIWQS